MVGSSDGSDSTGVRRVALSSSGERVGLCPCWRLRQTWTVNGGQWSWRVVGPVLTDQGVGLESGH